MVAKCMRHIGGSDTAALATVRDMSHPDAHKWLEAARVEMDQLIKNGTWERVQLPQDRKAIGSKWVFKIKRDGEGNIERYKGRLVAQGFSQ